jgi:hypothetical protein
MGLKYIQSIGLEVIHERVRCLTGWLLDNLLALRHPNGERLVRLYGPPDTNRRGGMLACNFYDRDGRPIDHWLIERQAGEANISMRTGCCRNPGAGEIALGLSKIVLVACCHQPVEHPPSTTSGCASMARAAVRCAFPWAPRPTLPTSSDLSSLPRAWFSRHPLHPSVWRSPNQPAATRAAPAAQAVQNSERRFSAR